MPLSWQFWLASVLHEFWLNSGQMDLHTKIIQGVSCFLHAVHMHVQVRWWWCFFDVFGGLSFAWCDHNTKLYIRAGAVVDQQMHFMLQSLNNYEGYTCSACSVQLDTSLCSCSTKLSWSLGGTMWQLRSLCKWRPLSTLLKLWVQSQHLRWRVSTKFLLSRS